MHKISCTKPMETYGDMSAARKIIFDGLSDEQLFETDKYEFCYHTLCYFDFPKLNSKDKSSIEASCVQITKLIGMDEVSGDEDAKLYDPLNRYMHYFLELDHLPGNEKLHLETMIDADIKKVDGWILDYETKYPYLLTEPKARNHAQRTIFDFYNRCKKERVTILEYKVNGLRSRAMYRASAYREVNTVFAMTDWYRDRPYKLSIPRSARYFLHEYIDVVSHRISPIPIRVGRTLRDLYKTDKHKFYEELEKNISISGAMAQIISSIKWLPLVNPSRVIIFEELERLFNEKRFYSFYALGIPQVEGLFLDMCKLCEPQFYNPTASLPDKVEFIRQYCEGHESDLDYFQYHFPNNRNSFLHYGIPEKESIDILAKDLLYDIFETLNIFLSLNADAIWLNRLLRSRDITAFSSSQDFTDYFELVDAVRNKKQLGYFDEMIKSLNETFFPELVFNIAYGLNEKVSTLFEKTFSKFADGTELAGSRVDFTTITNQQIADSKTHIVAALKEAMDWQLRDEVSELLSLKAFLKGYKKYFDLSRLEPGLEAELDQLFDRYKTDFSKISQIATLTEFKKK